VWVKVRRRARKSSSDQVRNREHIGVGGLLHTRFALRFRGHGKDGILGDINRFRHRVPRAHGERLTTDENDEAMEGGSRHDRSSRRCVT
jgi:hypothetical protein